MDRKCSILGFVFQNLSTKKMMSHITSYMVGESLGKIQGQQKASYYFIPLEMGQFVVSFSSLKGNWSVFRIPQTNPESKG